MVTFVELGNAISGLKGARDLLEGLKAVSDINTINEIKIPLQNAVVEAQDRLLEAQAAQSALLKRIDELEKEIVSLKDGQGDLGRYALYDVGAGVSAYMQKPGMESGEPPHFICPDCFQNGEKAILSKRQFAVGDSPWVCGKCAGIKMMLPAHITPNSVDRSS